MRLIDLLNMAIQKALKVGESQVSDEGVRVERVSNSDVRIKQNGKEQKIRLFDPPSPPHLD